MDAVELFCNGTMKAAVLHLSDKGIREVDAGKLSECLKKVLKEEIHGAIKEWEDAIAANMNEAWLRKLVNTQCNAIALKVLKEGEWL